MLNFMRRHARSTTIKILFWVIIAVFVLWGVGSFRSDQALYAASVNGEAISPKEVRRAALQLERFYRQIYGENFSPELAKALDFKSRALDQTINTALLRQEARRLGLSVSEDELRGSIAAIPGLAADGRFQRDVYFRYLRSQGLTPAEFEAGQRDALLVQKMQSLISSSIHPDEEAARSLYGFTNERVNLSFVRVKASDEARDIAANGDEVKDYYEKHRESFREPERVSIDYVSYTEKDFRSRVEASEQDIEEEYNAFKRERYTQPEEVHARHILLRVPPDAEPNKKEEIRARAAAVLERLKKGEDFAALAKEHSEDPSNKDKGGDLGFFSRGRMEEALESASFALQPGELSGVVETRYGFHIIRVDERRPEREQPLEEVRERIGETLVAEKARKQAGDAAFDDSQQALAGKPLEEIAKARALEVHSPPPFAENETVAGLPHVADLVKDAFATTAGQVGPIKQGGGQFLLFRVKEKIPSHVPELKEIQSRVEKALREERGAAKAREHAEAIRKLLAEPRPLEEVAKTENLKVEETGPFTRSGDYVPRIGTVPGLKRRAFALKPESPVASEVYSSDGDAFVVVLKERAPADMTEFEKKKDDLVKRYVEDQRQAAIQALLNQLKKRSSVQINQAALGAA